MEKITCIKKHTIPRKDIEKPLQENHLREASFNSTYRACYKHFKSNLNINYKRVFDYLVQLEQSRRSHDLVDQRNMTT